MTHHAFSSRDASPIPDSPGVPSGHAIRSSRVPRISQTGLRPSTTTLPSRAAFSFHASHHRQIPVWLSLLAGGFAAGASPARCAHGAFYSMSIDAGRRPHRPIAASCATHEASPITRGVTTMLNCMNAIWTPTSRTPPDGRRRRRNGAVGGGAKSTAPRKAPARASSAQCPASRCADDTSTRPPQPLPSTRLHWRSKRL